MTHETGGWVQPTWKPARTAPKQQWVWVAASIGAEAWYIAKAYLSHENAWTFWPGAGHATLPSLWYPCKES